MYHDKSAARESIASYRARLQSETDPAKLATLLKLLLDEEDKLGISLEHLADIEQEIGKGSKRIEHQRFIIETLERSGQSATVAKNLLESLTQTQALYSCYGNRLLIELNRNELLRSDSGTLRIRSFETLSPREKQIAILVAEGFSNKAIALVIAISEGTVKMHIHNIYQKLDIRCRATLASFTTGHRYRSEG
jgi:ATP/maltotriose-dependent transcriptional regulator MalT